MPFTLKPALGLLLSVALVVGLQAALFGIDLWMALLSIPLAICLAVVAARVAGATGIAPIGAIGKLSQLSFGLIAPGQVGINLMSANTAGGAAGQSTDLMNDFKVGLAIGATPHKQLVAQCIGIFIGSIVGVLVYLLLIPDPHTMLLTKEWPAPAVATWKAVAQTLTHGLQSLSPEIRWAIVIGSCIGALLGALDSLLPQRLARWLPSTAALGLAFVLPASTSMMMGAGAVLTWLVSCRWKVMTDRFAITAAAGLIAGESITGVGASFWSLLKNL
ncbi:MAG: oligopeptide transporter, superfamily [Pseudomonas sp.]|nr:oligopeptide transporter, superfamily [Pseudomonas sp.]